MMPRRLGEAPVAYAAPRSIGIRVMMGLDARAIKLGLVFTRRARAKRLAVNPARIARPIVAPLPRADIGSPEPATEAVVARGAFVRPHINGWGSAWAISTAFSVADPAITHEGRGNGHGLALLFAIRSGEAQRVAFRARAAHVVPGWCGDKAARKAPAVRAEVGSVAAFNVHVCSLLPRMLAYLGRHVKRNLRPNPLDGSPVLG